MLAALNEEKTLKTQLMKDNIKKMTEEILSLSRTIGELRAEFDSGDVQFLQVSLLFFLLCLSFHSLILCNFKRYSKTSTCDQ